ncbi:hypothetical protein O9992_03555 [Vibrio lentus]|nr:hypothetical protein [Vibrio lentus]
MLSSTVVLKTSVRQLFKDLFDKKMLPMIIGTLSLETSKPVVKVSKSLHLLKIKLPLRLSILRHQKWSKLLKESIAQDGLVRHDSKARDREAC